ncbi:MAG: phosphoribosylglycinamide formyltransferase [Vampirovibrionales bacterium]|nr:phosphoribosylglycinamide formyltransferase [Vampirovibrionales bacterium]
MASSIATPRLLRLAILISGRGSNMAALLKAEAEGFFNTASGQGFVALVLSNRPEAAGIATARAAHKPVCLLDHKAFESRHDFDAALSAVLQAANIDWVILAGYDRILGLPVLSAFPDRILNIHPSLLPKFGGKGMVGLSVHEAVLAAKESESGCTVHSVIAQVDAGPILGQARVAVLPDDTPESLAARVLSAENALYPKVVRHHVLGA